MGDAVKVAVKSDGTPQGTRVFDLATGRPVDFVSSIVWSIQAGGQAQLVLKVHDPSVGPLQIEAHPFVEVDLHYLQRLIAVERSVVASVRGLEAERESLEATLPPSLFELLSPLLDAARPG